MSEEGASGLSGVRLSKLVSSSTIPAGSDCDAGLAVNVAARPVVKSKCFCSNSEVIPPINPSMSNSEYTPGSCRSAGAGIEPSSERSTVLKKLRSGERATVAVASCV